MPESSQSLSSQSAPSTALRRIAMLGVLVTAGLFVLGGCRTSAQNGALIGAGAGALGGYVIGNEHDKK